MKKVAILATDGFEEVELTSPLEAMKKEGFESHLISDKPGQIKAWDKDHWSKEYDVDKTIDQVNVEEYDGLLLPGGVINPDTLRTNQDALNLIVEFFKAKKPVAAICHGPQLLISAGVVSGRKMTSFKSIKDDLVNAGAEWVDEEVVVDQGFVTSRNPNDLPAFNAKLIEEVNEGKHLKQHA